MVHHRQRLGTLTRMEPSGPGSSPGPGRAPDNPLAGTGAAAAHALSPRARRQHPLSTSPCSSSSSCPDALGWLICAHHEINTVAGMRRMRQHRTAPMHMRMRVSMRMAMCRCMPVG